MPIKKRLTKEQALKARLPKGWRACLRHPILKALCSHGHFNATPQAVDTALRLTKTWKGASWVEKVFVHILDILLEKSGREGVLSPDQYTRLQNHLVDNLDKIYQADFRTWHIWLWDIYHDRTGLLDLETGALYLPELPRKKPLATRSTPKPAKPLSVSKKRRKLPKHS